MKPQNPRDVPAYPKDGAAQRTRAFVWVLCATSLWLVAGGVSFALQKHVVELYGEQGNIPFTLLVWWKSIPWLVVALLSLESIAMFTVYPAESSFRRSAFLSIILCVLAGFYALFCFLPLLVTLSPIQRATIHHRHVGDVAYRNFGQ